MTAPDARRKHARVSRLIVVDAYIDNDRRLGSSDEPGKLSHSDDIGGGHVRLFLVARCGDAMLRPKPHGAIAVNPLRPNLVTEASGVNSGPAARADWSTRVLRSCDTAVAT